MENKSLWESVDTNKEIKPKIVFGFNQPVKVTFPSDFIKPEEYPSKFGDNEDKSYCVFPVIHNGEDSAIVTSAFSLLRGLKVHEPLASKTLEITKRMSDGKQQYIVELVN